MFLKIIFFFLTFFSIPLKWPQKTWEKDVEEVHESEQKIFEKGDLALLFSKIVSEKNPQLSEERKKALQKTSLLIFGKLFPNEIKSIEQSTDDPLYFVVHTNPNLTGVITKVERGAMLTTALKLKTKGQIHLRFSPEDATVYIEKESYWGKILFFPKKYFLKKIKLLVENEPLSSISMEVQLENSFYHCKESEVFANLGHIQWR